MVSIGKAAIIPARGVRSLAPLRCAPRLLASPHGDPVWDHWHRHGVSRRPGLVTLSEGIILRSDEQVGNEVQRLLAPPPLPMFVPLRAHRVNELVLVLELLKARQALHDVLEVGVKDDFLMHVDEGSGGGVEDVEPMESRQQFLVFVNDLGFRLLLVFPRARLWFRLGPTKQHEYIPDPQLDMEGY